MECVYGLQRNDGKEPLTTLPPFPIFAELRAGYLFFLPIYHSTSLTHCKASVRRSLLISMVLSLYCAPRGEIVEGEAGTCGVGAGFRLTPTVYFFFLNPFFTEHMYVCAPCLPRELQHSRLQVFWFLSRSGFKNTDMYSFPCDKDLRYLFMRP